MDKRNNDSKKVLINYLIVAVTIVILFNALVLPQIRKMRIKETDYSTFLSFVEDGRVEQVEVDTNQIGFTVRENGKTQIYVTGRMDDPDLVDRLYRSGITFGAVIPNETSPLLVFILSWVAPILLFMFIGRMFAKKLGASGPMSFGKSHAKVYAETDTGISFKDVAGQDEAKEALQEIVDFLHHPEKYRAIGAKIPKGALLVGPPGTGKTLLAKAVAGEAHVPFFSISGSEFVEMFVGMGAARVRDLFKQAQAKAPCIIFIDEIDTIGKNRNSSIGNDEREQTLNQLLTEMDGFSSEKGLVILAATNRPDVLDKALLRPGRFDRRIPVELPDLRGREAILKVHAKKIKLSSDVDFHTIARATPGASGADLANIINEAALRAVRFGRDVVIQSDLEESVEVVLAGYQRKNAVLSPRDKLTVSYHEIGHALVAAMQENTAPVHKITIIPRTSGALGYTMQVEQDEQVLMTKEQALGKIKIYMGGRAAEELIFNTITTGASNDIEQATKIARAMVTRFGMSETFDMMALETMKNQYLSEDSALTVAPETAARVDEEVLRIIRTCHQEARQILEENITKLHELAKHLYERETITGEEFMAILGQ